MSTKTTNYDLTLPEENEFYDVNIVNENNRKIDIGLQENKQAVINHENKTSKHLTSEQAEKIESALQPIQEYTEGNFVSVDKNGNIIDSGLSADDFENSDHNTKSVYSENGVHCIRYYEDKLQVFNGVQWTDITEKSTIQVQVAVDSGSTVTATDGIETLTETSVNGVATFSIPNYGDWIFSATLNGENSDTVTLVIDTMKLYNISLVFTKGYIRVTSSTNYFETLQHNLIYNGDVIQSITAKGGAIQKEFAPVNKPGNYTVELIDPVHGKAISRQSVNVASGLNYYTYKLKVRSISVWLNTTDDISKKISMTVDGVSLAENVDITKHAIDFTIPENVNNGEISVISKDGSFITFETTGSIGSFNSESTMIITVNKVKVYTVNINTTISDPSNSVSYSNESTGMTAGSTSWDTTDLFINIHPCLFDSEEHTIKGACEPTDFSKAVGTGMTWKSLLGDTYMNKYDTMIYIPRMGYRINKNGNNIQIDLTAENNIQGFNYNAFLNKDGKPIDYFLIGAYNGRVLSKGVRSISGYEPTKSLSFSSFRAYVKECGDYYDIMGFEQLKLLQCLFLMRYKTLNSQSNGMGYSTSSTLSYTGKLDTKGMYYFGSEGVKFCGIEHFFSNMWQFVDGVCLDSSSAIRTCQKDFVNGSYEIKGGTSNGNGYISTVAGDEYMGFLPKSYNGSSTTWYCDYATVTVPTSSTNPNYMSYGGDCGGTVQNGIFAIQINKNINSYDAKTGARCMYRPEVD